MMKAYAQPRKGKTAEAPASAPTKTTPGQKVKGALKKLRTTAQNVVNRKRG